MAVTGRPGEGYLGRPQPSGLADVIEVILDKRAARSRPRVPPRGGGQARASGRWQRDEWGIAGW